MHIYGFKVQGIALIRKIAIFTLPGDYLITLNPFSV